MQNFRDETAPCLEHGVVTKVIESFSKSRKTLKSDDAKTGGFTLFVSFAALLKTINN